MIKYTILTFVVFLLGASAWSAKTVILGDVEGQLPRLMSFLETSGAFDVSTINIKLKPGYNFVFIGDATDRGPSSIQILTILQNLKEKYPSRVVLILGNRDINKLRLPNELSRANLGPPNEEAATQSLNDWLEEKQIPEVLWADPVTRIRWIFEKTMGAGGAFEFRREELNKLKGKPISDQEVLESFLSDFDPDTGLFSRYLSSAQLAYRDVANRALFVHGGLTMESFGYVPGSLDHFSNVQEWIDHLNRWAQLQIIDGIQNASGSIDLVRYQQPEPGTKANQASVVYGRNFDTSANPELPPEELQNRLINQGIDTVVVGHTPVGQIPLVISNGRFRMIFVDNSFSPNPLSGIVTLESGVASVKGQVQISDERTIQIDYRHTLGGHQLEGTKTSEGWVVAVVDGQPLTFRVDRDAGFRPVYNFLLSGGLSCWKLFE